MHAHAKTLFSIISCECSVGSTPRAWGKRSDQRANRGARTFHPHVRGENMLYNVLSRFSSILHPHVRGENVRFMFFLTHHLILHPHVRGEN